MAGFIFDARAALSEIQEGTPATVATTATKPGFGPEMSQLSQLSQPLPGENAALVAPDPDAFEERAGILEFDAGLPRHEAEALAAQEQGHADADSLHRESVRRWTVEIDRLAKLPAVSPDGAEALKRARAFIGEGWALQAARLGWDEVELFGVCPRAPWQRFDRKGTAFTAFSGGVSVVTQDAVVYVGGMKRHRALVNNDHGAVLIWELAQDTPSSGGFAA